MSRIVHRHSPQVLAYRTEIGFFKRLARRRAKAGDRMIDPRPDSRVGKNGHGVLFVVGEVSQKKSYLSHKTSFPKRHEA